MRLTAARISAALRGRSIFPRERKNEEFPLAGYGQPEAGSVTGGILELGNQDVWPNFIQKTRDAYLQLAALGW